MTPSHEVVITRTLRAPRDLVFQAWTDAKHVAAWFAPLGFTGRAELDVRPGGALHIVMVGPDGTEYPIRGRYVEVSPTTRLSYIEDVTEHPAAWHATLRELMAKHSAHHAPSNCLVTATFEALEPAVTKLTLTTRAESAGEIAAYLDMGMLEGWGHCLDKLQDLVTEGRSLKNERWLDAPRAVVYQAFTDPHHLDQWWGPNGFRLTTYHHDVRPGGSWTYTMHGPDGTDYPNKMVFEEVVPEQRLSYAHGEIEGPPWFHTTITFAEHEGRTLVQLRSVFDAVEGLEKARQYGAEEGGRQTLGRLAQALGNRLDISLPDDLSIVMKRTLRAPRALVWKAMTEPQHLKQWWGLRRHTLVTCEVDLRVGGTYRFVERDPEGNEYAFHGAYLEIVPEQRSRQTFIFEPMPEHVATVTFELEERDGQTTFTETIRHTSKEARDGHLYSGMEVGANESMDRLDELLTALATEVVLSRTYAAPRDRVWAALTRPEHLARWWGPAGMTMEIKHFDLRPEGTMIYGMTPPGGETFFGKWHVRAVEPPHQLDVLISFCDADGHLLRHPMAPVWPLRMRCRVRLEDLGAETRLTLTNAPFGGTAEEVQSFVAGHPSMQQGFGASLDALERVLAKG